MSGTLSRRDMLRDVMGVAMAIPFSEWLERSVSAKPVPRMRHGVHTKKGQRQLDVLSAAIKEMKFLGHNDSGTLSSRSWTYQYKVHQYPDNCHIFNLPSEVKLLAKAQQAELDHFYPPGEPKWKQKRENAAKVWGTCPHGPEGHPDFFAWHRMYLTVFEKIIRCVSNRPDFTLPYWGYSAKTRRIIPWKLRVPLITVDNTRVENPLCNPRNLLLNDVHSPEALEDTHVDQTVPNDYWSQDTFEKFSKVAEKIPHGSLHIDLGDNEFDGFDMAKLSTAPKDPIFWLHHCELDRIWHSWTESGGAPPDPNAAWLKQSYYFVDAEETLVVFKGSEVLQTTDLGYTYDQVVPKPTTRAALAKVELETPTTIAEATDVALKAVKTVVGLQTQPGIGAMKLADIRSQRYILNFEGATAKGNFSANLEVYLNLPKSPTAAQRRLCFVGLIAVLGGFHSHSGMQGETHSLEVTLKVQQLVAQKLWIVPPAVTVIVSGGGLRGVEPRFAKVSLVQMSRPGR